jgi:hypothetical protein
MSHATHPQLHLVDDEEIALKVKGHFEVFRLRIWRTDGEPALVLVSQVPGNVPPSAATERLANCVKRVWLAYGPLFYFERNGKDLQSVNFVTIGPAGYRPILSKPQHRTVAPNFIAELLGQVVD